MFTANGRRPVLPVWLAELAQLAQSRPRSAGSVVDPRPITPRRPTR